ncbi:MAG: RNA polymerase sigma factor [Alphaproteobacteria bacterium]
MTDTSAEADWVQSAQAGSADAFGRLVHMHQQGLRAFLRRLSGHAADADDLAQDTFVFAWEHIDRFEAGRSFRPWLFGIAWRKHREKKRSWLRLIRREAAAATPDNGFTPDPGLKLDLLKAAESLPMEQRAAILLCLGAEFTHAEAAEALAMPLGTVKSHLARGREKMALLLGGSNG